MYTATELASIARRYFPFGLSVSDEQYHLSEETRRRDAARQDAQKFASEFSAFVRELQGRYPERWIGNENSLWIDPCVSLRMTTKRLDPEDPHEAYVVGCISIIAPVYMEYLSVGDGKFTRVSYEPEREHVPAFGEVGTAFEQRFAVERVPPEVGLIAVPDLAVGNRDLGEAVIYDCLFTPHRW